MFIRAIFPWFCTTLSGFAADLHKRSQKTTMSTRRRQKRQTLTPRIPEPKQFMNVSSSEKNQLSVHGADKVDLVLK